jgi:hypothetical protein
MQLEPISDCLLSELAFRNPHYTIKLCVYRSAEIIAVKTYHKTHSFKPCPFIPVYKRMIAYNRIAKRCGFAEQIWIQILPPK